LTANAEALDWDLLAFRTCFAELATRNMAKADWKARLIFIPGVLIDNRPESPNVVKAWRSAFDELPDCALRTEIMVYVKRFLKALPKAFREAFDHSLPKATPLSVTEAVTEAVTEPATEPARDSRHSESRYELPSTSRLGDDPIMVTFKDRFDRIDPSLRKRKAGYRWSSVDWIQVQNLRKRLTIERDTLPHGWHAALDNYFQSPRRSTGCAFKLSDLCARFEMFLEM
jgi:hypothetical protein